MKTKTRIKTRFKKGFDFWIFCSILALGSDFPHKKTNQLIKMATNILTHSQFAQLLAQKKGAVILSIVADTDARALKTGNPHKEIRKVTYTRVVSGAKYQDAVDRQGAVGFKSEGLPYGEFASKELSNKVIKTDSGKLQLRTVGRNPQKPIRVQYIVDGVPVEYETIKQFLPAPKESKKQALSGVRGKRQVMVRNYDFPNILKVTYAGTEYTLIPDIKTPQQVKQVIAKKQGMRRRLHQISNLPDQLRHELMYDVEGWGGHKDAY